MESQDYILLNRFRVRMTSILYIPVGILHVKVIQKLQYINSNHFDPPFPPSIMEYQHLCEKMKPAQHQFDCHDSHTKNIGNCNINRLQTEMKHSHNVHYLWHQFSKTGFQLVGWSLYHPCILCPVLKYHPCILCTILLTYEHIPYGECNQELSIHLGGYKP